MLAVAAIGLTVTGGSAGTDRYTVKRGDTLTSIAAAQGTTAGALATANGLTNANRIVIGQSLRLPSAAPATGASTPGAKGALPAKLQASPKRLALRPLFDKWAAANGIPSDLLQALCWMESGWQNTVVSSTGAVGIGQLMPDTVALMRLFIGRPSLDPAKPEDNIRMSARFLGYLLRQTGGDVKVSLAAYYQGLRSVRAKGLLPETERYVAVILALRSRFA